MLVGGVPAIDVGLVKANTFRAVRASFSDSLSGILSVFLACLPLSAFKSECLGTLGREWGVVNATWALKRPPKAEELRGESSGVHWEVAVKGPVRVLEELLSR